MAVPGIGTVVNVATISLGSGLGWAIGKRMPERISEIVLQGIGLVVVVVGVQMALTSRSAAQFSIVIVSMVLGAVSGELINIEHGLNRLGQAIEWWVARRFGPNPITKAFVASSLLFLVGPMAILGGDSGWIAGGSVAAADQVGVGWHRVDRLYRQSRYRHFFLDVTDRRLSRSLDADWHGGGGFCE